MSRTSAADTFPAPWAIAWSSIDRPSRAEPSAAVAIIASASVSTSTSSALATSAKCAASLSAGMRRKSKRWQRDSTVTGTLLTSVVARKNFTCSGGSSSVFSKPLNAGLESMCTSSMM